MSKERKPYRKKVLTPHERLIVVAMAKRRISTQDLVALTGIKESALHSFISRMKGKLPGKIDSHPGFGYLYTGDIPKEE